MGIFDALFKTARTPDLTVPLTENLNNEIYLNGGESIDFNLFNHVNEFVAREFTKVMVTFKGDFAAQSSLDYMLNVKPNDNQTANNMLYVFAKSMLDHGWVYYKISKPANRTVQSIEISAVAKPGFKQFNEPQLKKYNPQDLLDKYDKLLHDLSSKTAANVLELNTKLNASELREEGETYRRMAQRLNVLRTQMNKYGAFSTLTNESAKDHQGMVRPDSAALADLRALIYEEININPTILNGAYSEADYRAFFATHLMPITAALEELLNAEVVGRDDYMGGASIKVVLDLMQFSTLESFTEMAKEGIYNSYLTADEVRASLGKDKLPGGLGGIIYSNKNAVAINDPAVNARIDPKTNGSSSSASSGSDEQQPADDDNSSQSNN